MRISNIIAGWAILIASVALAAPTQQQDQPTAPSANEPDDAHLTRYRIRATLLHLPYLNMNYLQALCPCKYGESEKTSFVSVNFDDTTRAEFDQAWNVFCPCMGYSHIDLDLKDNEEVAPPGLTRRGIISIEEHNQPRHG